MKKVLTTIYYTHDEDYPVVRLTGRTRGMYRARVPTEVAARYRAAVTSYHAAVAALGQALDAYEKTLPPQKGPRYLGVTSCE